MMQVERARPRRSSNSLGIALTCGAVALVVLVACGVIALLLLPRVTDIAASSVGLERSSTTTQALFSNTAPTPVQVFNATSPSQVTITVPDAGTQTIAVNPALYPVAIGQSAEGAPLMTAQVSEDSAIQLCRQYTPICQNADPRLQNIALDFRPNGALVSGDVTLPELGGITQRVGAALVVDSSGTQLRFAGIEVGGVLYEAPSGELAAQIAELERLANQILLTSAVSSDGISYSISSLQIDDNRATLVLR
jgi:hypothetical protein